MTRQKKPVTVYDDSSVEALANVDPHVVEEYLNTVSFTLGYKGGKFRRIYEYVKLSMMKSLSEKQRNDPLFGALIERIARMTVILDRIERQLFNGVEGMSEEQLVDKLGGNYRHYLESYRSFINSFSDLRWAGDQMQKSRSVEKIREITREATQSAAV